MSTGQVIVWFDTTNDADFWWERLLTHGIEPHRFSARVVMWFTR